MFGPSRNSITRYWRPFGRQAVLEGLDDAGMLELHGDFAFARLVEPLEAGLEGGRLLRVEDLQPHDLARPQIAGHVEARHRAGNRLVQQHEPLRHVQPRRRRASI